MKIKTDDFELNFETCDFVGSRKRARKKQSCSESSKSIIFSCIWGTLSLEIGFKTDGWREADLQIKIVHIAGRDHPSFLINALRLNIESTFLSILEILVPHVTSYL